MPRVQLKLENKCPDEFQLLKKAAEKKWPDAVMTNSGILLALAKITARESLSKPKR
jgi:hypothetical protein